jgi:transmembrane sensor
MRAGIHDAASEWLVRLQVARSGKSDPAIERKFAAWLNADERHRLAYAQAERDWQDSLMLAGSQVGQTRKLGRAPFLMRRDTHVKMAAIGIAAVLGLGTVGLVRHGPAFQVGAPAEAAIYQTGIGEIRTVRLSDGSQVTLDTATLLRVAFNAHGRQLSLQRGRARFRVAPDSRRPFRVEVPGGEVVARSTLFDVSVFTPRPVVAALEGSVELRPAAGASPASRMLCAGQSAVLGDRNDPVPASSGETRWVSGMLTLDGAALADAVAAVNRYNRMQVRLGDARLSRLTVTGAFPARDPEGFVRALAAAFRLAVDRSEPGTIVLRPRPDKPAPP